MHNKSILIKTGDFFFKWRNLIFPLILIVIFSAWMPPAEYFGTKGLEDFKDLVAGFIIFSGLALRSATIGWAYIKRGGINKTVYADTLVTRGYFGLCRNPLYVGNMLIYAGVFLIHGHPAVIVLGIMLYYFIYQSIIAAEEYYLTQKFGAEYLEYCKQVPRWMLKISNAPTALDNMTFNIKRSIAKDYTTILNACAAIVLIELLERYAFYPRADFIESVQVGGVVLAVLFIGAVTIKALKKYTILLNVVEENQYSCN